MVKQRINTSDILIDSFVGWYLNTGCEQFKLVFINEKLYNAFLPVFKIYVCSLFLIIVIIV